MEKIINELDGYLNKIFNEHERLFILIKGSPDPDAMASAFFLMELAKQFQCEATIIHKEILSLPQNLLFVHLLSIPIMPFMKMGRMKHYEGYIVVDHQSIEDDSIPLDFPCVLHLDHHEPAREEKKPLMKVLDRRVNSVSSLLALLCAQKDYQWEEGVKKRLCTALYYGIMTDTNNLAIQTKYDVAAVEMIGPFTNREMIEDLKKVSLTEATKRILKNSVEDHIINGSWFISGVGYVKAEERDHIAIAADYLLRRRDIENVVIFALIVDDKNKKMRLDASFRTKNPRSGLNSFIKKITLNGGASHYKGAFQYPLDLFYLCPERNDFWDVVKGTVINNILSVKSDFSKDQARSFLARWLGKIKSIWN